MTHTSAWVVRSYVAGVAVAAAVMLLQATWSVPSASTAFWNVFAALVGLGLLSSAFSLRARVGTHAVSFVPYLGSLIMLGPAWAMVVAGVSEVTADALFLRKPLIRVVHNTSKEILAVGVAGYLYLVLGGSFGFDAFPSPIPALVPAFAAAVAIYFVLSNGASATAVALSGAEDLVEGWRELVWKPFGYNVMSASLSVLLAFLYIELNFAGLLLVIIPLFFLRHAHSVNFKLEQVNRDLLELMVKSIEARDPYTSGHSLRVARIAKLMARGLNLSSKEVEQIETAALMHDVGKIYEEFAPILRKEGRLTSEEQRLMHSHPIRSAELVATISSLRGYVEQCVRHHHENWDGGGYPDGLMAAEIPLGARIVMIADTADAMMTDRPYRKALSYARVVSEFEKYSGKQFDPALVIVFKKSAAIRRMVEDRPLPPPALPTPSPEKPLRAAVS